jgi:hypothetical protein
VSADSAIWFASKIGIVLFWVLIAQTATRYAASRTIDSTSVAMAGKPD